MFEVWKIKFFWSVWVLKMLGAPTWQWQPFSEKSELWGCGNGRNFEKVWALILLEVCSEKSELWCCLEFPRGNGRHFEKVWAPMLSGVPTWQWPPFWEVLARPAPAGSLFIVPRKLRPWGGTIYCTADSQVIHMYPVYWSSSHLCVYLNFTLIQRLACCSLNNKVLDYYGFDTRNVVVYDRPSHVGLRKGKKVNMTS